MTVMKQQFQMRMRMPCSICLCTKGGGVIWPFETITQRGELFREGGGLLRGGIIEGGGLLRGVIIKGGDH